jgi:hypothetical protein
MSSAETGFISTSNTQKSSAAIIAEPLMVFLPYSRDIHLVEADKELTTSVMVAQIKRECPGLEEI